VRHNSAQQLNAAALAPPSHSFLSSKKKVEMPELDLMPRWQALIRKIGSYIERKGRKLMVVNVEGGSMEAFRKAIDEVKNEEMLVCVSTEKDGQPAELVRWPFYDIQFCIDARPSGKFGITGSPTKIMQVAALVPEVFVA
jgi:hypothetical protein